VSRRLFYSCVMLLSVSQVINRSESHLFQKLNMKCRVVCLCVRQHGMVRPWVVGGEDRLIWRVAANTSKKQLWTADKGRSCSLRVWREANNSLPYAVGFLRNLIDSFERIQRWKMNLTEIRLEGVDRIHLAQDRGQWRTVVNTVM
jgi:hypothetical protein